MSYKDQQKEWNKRRTKIVRLHATGKHSYRDIGAMLDPPVTPQRIRAILISEGAVKKPKARDNG